MSKILSDISLKIIQRTMPSKPNAPHNLAFRHKSRQMTGRELRWVVGIGLSTAIGYLGWRKGSLSGSGFAGAMGSGTLITGAGGYVHSAMLVGFFLSSSALSRLPSNHASQKMSSITQKGGRRDAWQALANGGVPTVLALGSSTESNLACLGALAAVTGDTWATEIGSRYGANPRSILTLRPVQPGASGGITSAGLLASALGGTFIGTVAAGMRFIDPAFARSNSLLLIGSVTAAIVGSAVDSIVGAALQERRWCDACQQFTERTIHSCGQPTRLINGIPGLDNDVVNLICSLSGAVTAWGMARILRRYS
jgi:uncharacterized protein (TIGR00297 family)